MRIIAPHLSLSPLDGERERGCHITPPPPLRGEGRGEGRPGRPGPLCRGETGTRHTWYDSRALLDGGLDRLVEYGLQRFAAGRPLSLDRLILTGHSGGGMPAIDAIAGARRPPDELFVFD